MLRLLVDNHVGNQAHPRTPKSDSTTVRHLYSQLSRDLVTRLVHYLQLPTLLLLSLCTCATVPIDLPFSLPPLSSLSSLSQRLPLYPSNPINLQHQTWGVVCFFVGTLAQSNHYSSSILLLRFSLFLKEQKLLLREKSYQRSFLHLKAFSSTYQTVCFLPSKRIPTASVLYRIYLTELSFLVMFNIDCCFHFNPRRTTFPYFQVFLLCLILTGLLGFLLVSYCQNCICVIICWLHKQGILVPKDCLLNAFAKGHFKKAH